MPRVKERGFLAVNSMKKKKFLTILLAAGMLLSLCACGASTNGTTENESSTANDNADVTDNTENDTAATNDTATTNNASTTTNTNVEGSDLSYVQNKGTLIVGITEFEPMDYQDANGSWIGFDADMAAAFAESLNVDAQFQIIDWDNKVFELDGKTIDVVWNGMTLNDEVKSSMECSNPYFNNAQVIIVPADEAASYQTAESVKDLSFAVESGSAGQQQAEANNFTFTEVADQATALLEVSSGTADAAIVDFLMAKAMTGDGTSYSNLTYTASLNNEEYGVGFRKGSDLATALNAFLKTSYEDGTMEMIADTYNIAEALIAQ